MSYLQFILAGLTIAGLAGGTAAWFKRSAGTSALSLAQSTISIYKEREATHLQQINELVIQNAAKDKTIIELRATIRTMVREFKDYKSGK